MEQETITLIDPPQGWLYGFPKECPFEDIFNADIKSWLISEGYPKELIEEYGATYRVIRKPKYPDSFLDWVNKETYQLPEDGSYCMIEQFGSRFPHTYTITELYNHWYKKIL